ncbi:hypothetical protein [Saccharothrix deserti]|uniref:hypothetical protein n=1 Tax=Saccharothrix deserti TaxID=2593674 RepID=UPI00131B8CB6|nr:hypothetical protein [Saccharothrix deserti]
MEKASGDSATWLVICWFDSVENVTAWGQSRLHETWREYIGRFATPGGVGVSTTAPPADVPAPPVPPAAPSPPPRWKMALMTLTGVFPAVLLVNVTVIPQVAGLPLVARTFVLCVCVTVLMTWVLMPQVQKLLGPWLRRGTAPVAPPSGDDQPDLDVAPTSTSHGLRPVAVPADNGARSGSRPPRAARARHAAPATSPGGQQSRSRRR